MMRILHLLECIYSILQHWFRWFQLTNFATMQCQWWTWNTPVFPYLAYSARSHPVASNHLKNTGGDLGIIFTQFNCTPEHNYTALQQEYIVLYASPGFTSSVTVYIRKCNIKTVRPYHPLQLNAKFSDLIDYPRNQLKGFVCHWSF